MKRALISVSDKAGIVEFAKNLSELDYEIVSTGGTYKAISDAGIPVISVDSVTGFGECLNGRVKTLHPAVHGGILAIRENPEHMEHIKSLNIAPIDIVAVNLYPFKNTILKESVTKEEAIENIDIGGPAMVRSAAKNYRDVAVVTDPADYAKIIEEMKQKGEICGETKLYLSAKAFVHTAAYDALIAEYMKELAGMEVLSETVTLTFEKKSEMRYGENPHQNAAYYSQIRPMKGSLNKAAQLHGKELSFNNINDLSGAVALLKEFEKPTCVCVKHSVPCGVGEADNIYEAYMKAYSGDPVSVYGGIVALNRKVDRQTAVEMNKIFLEIVIAPDFDEDALAVLKEKKNIRIMKDGEVGFKPDKKYYDMKKVLGGLLIQEADDCLLNADEVKCVTKTQPTKEQMEDLIFAFKVVKHAKSNAITVCKNGQAIGIGGGQVRRSWAFEQAVEHAREMLGEGITNGAVVASDAYFPYGDSVEIAHKAGISAIIQPGGSVRDDESIELCDKYGIAMLFTGMRHFRH